MLIPEFENIHHLKEFLVENLEYHEDKGFSICGIFPGMEFHEVPKVLGEPEVYNTENDQQQTMQYNSYIHHPAHGKREHYKLNMLFWAFHREPFKIIKLHFDYHKTGNDAEDFNVFLKDFFKLVIEKFGMPEKKTFRFNREELVYMNGKKSMRIWNNAEGVRIELK